MYAVVVGRLTVTSLGDHLKSQHKGEVGEEGFSGRRCQAAEMWGDDREKGVWLWVPSQETGLRVHS